MGTRIVSVAWMLLLGLIMGCGGGGGGSGGSVPTGSVAVLVTDGPADQYESIFISITRVSLIPAGGGPLVPLFDDDDGEVIDILKLRDEELLLTIEDDVPAGLYEGIVLEIDDAETEGGECDDLEVRFPSGKIIVKDDDDFEVILDSVLTVELDVDANKSIHLHPAGNSGMCILRPVIHATFGREEMLDEPCLRAVSGTIEEFILEGEDPDGGDEEITGLILDLGADRGTLNVVYDDTTPLFDETGAPTSNDILEVGQQLGGRGTLDDDGNLVAQVLFQDDTVELEGEIAATDDDGFALEIDDDGDSDTIDVVVVDETLILADCEPSGPGALIVGNEAEVLGFGGAASGELFAYVVFVGPAEFDGDLTSVTETDDGLDIVVIPEENGGPLDLTLPDGTDITFEGNAPIDLDLLQDLLACQARPVTVTLDSQDSEVATAVELNGEDFEDEVESVDADASEIVFDDGTVRVQPGASLLDLTGDEQQELDIGDLEVGDRVRVFGLESCEEDTFEGFVVLRLPDEVPDPEGEGCGVGFWKQPHHFDSWPEGIEPDHLFSDHFDDAFPGKTLLDVLKQGGGHLNALGRHTVSAFLNDASDEIDFDSDSDSDSDSDGGEDEIGDASRNPIEEFNDVYPGSNTAYEELKDEFEDLNERDCPLD